MMAFNRSMHTNLKCQKVCTYICISIHLYIYKCERVCVVASENVLVVLSL